MGCKPRRTVNLVFGSISFLNGSGPQPWTDFPPFSLWTNLCACLGVFGQHQEKSPWQTDAFFSVFCLGMWVPAGQAIGESSVRGQVHTVGLSLCVHWGLVLGGDWI